MADLPTAVGNGVKLVGEALVPGASQLIEGHVRSGIAHFLIGGVVEIFYGKWRYLLIYLLSGIAGGIVTYFVMPPGTLAAGASGAIFGVFGALGVFYLANRQALGRYGTGAITNWLFWLGLNLVFGFTNSGSIGIWDHIGGLVAGMIIGALLIPRTRRRPL